MQTQTRECNTVEVVSKPTCSGTFYISHPSVVPDTVVRYRPNALLKDGIPSQKWSNSCTGCVIFQVQYLRVRYFDTTRIVRIVRVPVYLCTQEGTISDVMLVYCKL